MVDPRIGVAATNEFFSLAAVHDWLKKHGPQPAWKLLAPALPEPEIAPELRAERVKMLKATANVIRNTVKAKCVGRPSTQGHYPDKLLDALGTLKSLQPDGERTGA
jgi:hypothetical protein